ncbi:MAG: hypothetical protein DMG76_18800 [Acidobacteria bacterium]|nr:MAG: hypothetical protein DMG76_18800 [Acidobacteriota bacterium]
MKRALPSFVFRAVAMCSLVLLGLSYAPVVQAQSGPVIQQLFGFACDSSVKVCPDGEQPNTLLQSADGNFYGTTGLRGTGNQPVGAIFKITPSGQFTLLHTFVADQNGSYPNGAGPNSLVEGNDGFLYGTASGGPFGNSGNGVAFKISKTGMFQIIHNFCSSTDCSDSTNPFGLTLGDDGNFYGGSFGELWRMTPKGTVTALHTFNQSVEGPTARGITLGSDGNLYGTALGGQTIFTTLFRLTSSGQFTILHTWHYSAFPTSAPVQSADGNLYGVQNAEMLFREARDGTGYTANTMTGPPALESPLFAIGGDFWSVNNSSSPETMIQISPGGTVLQTIPFEGSNGSGFMDSLVQAGDGRLFGIADDGGTVQSGQIGKGVVFVLDAGLAAPAPAFISFGPSAGKVGTTVMIHGRNFVGTTAVTFNGASAAFRVLNTGNIRATVPAGATTGPISVTNKGGITASTSHYTVQ